LAWLSRVKDSLKAVILDMGDEVLSAFLWIGAHFFRAFKGVDVFYDCRAEKILKSAQIGYKYIIVL
jgi:hypothetical protein